MFIASRARHCEAVRVMIRNVDEPNPETESPETLVLQLFRTCHLSVRKRAALPDGQVPFSLLLRTVAASLEATGFFPAPLGADAGAAIERTPEGLVVHVQHEIGVMRVGPRKTESAPDLNQAIARFLEAVAVRGSLDGVRIETRDPRSP